MCAGFRTSHCVRDVILSDTHTNFTRSGQQASDREWLLAVFDLQPKTGHYWPLASVEGPLRNNFGALTPCPLIVCPEFLLEGGEWTW